MADERTDRVHAALSGLSVTQVADLPLRDSLTSSNGTSPWPGPSALRATSQDCSDNGLSATQAADLPLAQRLETNELMADAAEPKAGATLLLAPGVVLSERYEIRDRLGVGGMGAVFAAHDRVRAELIAVKVLLPRLVQDPRACERFISEGKIATALSHPHIVRVFDIQQDGARTFMTMELLTGRSLRTEILRRQQRQERFSIDEIRRIVEPLCDALQYAHKTTIHRDIKPENIWLSEDGSPKLMDFGVARLIRGSQVTEAGQAVGTAYYMSPEQLKGERDLDHRADQYAIGVLLYELLTGEIPQGAAPEPHQLRQSVPVGLSRATMRALSASRDGRFANMRTLRDAIIPAASSAGRPLKLGGLFAVVILALAAIATRRTWSPTLIDVIRMRDTHLKHEAEQAGQVARDKVSRLEAELQLAFVPPAPLLAESIKDIAGGDDWFRSAKDVEARSAYASAGAHVDRTRNDLIQTEMRECDDLAAVLAGIPGNINLAEAMKAVEKATLDKAAARAQFDQSARNNDRQKRVWQRQAQRLSIAQRDLERAQALTKIHTELIEEEFKQHSADLRQLQKDGGAEGSEGTIPRVIGLRGKLARLVLAFRRAEWQFFANCKHVWTSPEVVNQCENEANAAERQFKLTSPAESTPLLQSAARGCEVLTNGAGGVVDQILRTKTELSTESERGRSALHVAAETDDLEHAYMLVYVGASLDIQDDRGDSPLHLAAWNRHTEMARWLIEQGADVNASNNDSRTPLHNAAFQGELDIVKALVGHKSTVSLRDMHGDTPCMRAKSQNHREVARYLESLEGERRAKP